jgi:hypothetical protein
MNHRWGQRATVKVAVHLLGSSLAGSGILENVSLSGAYVRGSLRLPLLSRCRVIACVPTSNAPQRYEASACVVRHDPAGIGLEWLEAMPSLVSAVVPQAQASDDPTIGSRLRNSNHY